MSDTVIRVENISKLYRLGEVGTGSLAHDVNRWWHKVRGKEDPYLKIGEVNDRTKPAKQASSKKSLTTENTESTEESKIERNRDTFACIDIVCRASAFFNPVSGIHCVLRVLCG